MPGIVIAALPGIVIAALPKSVRGPNAVHTKNLWTKTLYVAAGCFVLRQCIPNRPHPCDTMNPREMDVAYSLFRIVVYQRSDAVKSEVVGEDAVIVGVTIRVHTCLEACHDISVL